MRHPQDSILTNGEFRQALRGFHRLVIQTHGDNESVTAAFDDLMETFIAKCEQDKTVANDARNLLSRICC